MSYYSGEINKGSVDWSQLASQREQFNNSLQQWLKQEQRNPLLMASHLFRLTRADLAGNYPSQCSELWAFRILSWIRESAQSGESYLDACCERITQLFTHVVLSFPGTPTFWQIPRVELPPHPMFECLTTLAPTRQDFEFILNQGFVNPALRLKLSLILMEDLYQLYPAFTNFRVEESVFFITLVAADWVLKNETKMSPSVLARVPLTLIQESVAKLADTLDIFGITPEVLTERVVSPSRLLWCTLLFNVVDYSFLEIELQHQYGERLLVQFLHNVGNTELNDYMETLPVTIKYNIESLAYDKLTRIWNTRRSLCEQYPESVEAVCLLLACGSFDQVVPDGFALRWQPTWKKEQVDLMIKAFNTIIAQLGTTVYKLEVNVCRA